MRHTLLLADDSVTIQRVIELTFADENVDVVAVGDGDAALACLDATPPPDIVLADIAMPGKNGYEVARYIKESPRLAHIPVLLLTGAFEPVDQAKAAEAGCDGILAKPFEPQMVIGRVTELLKRPRDGSSPSPPPIEEAGPARPAAATGDLGEYFDRLDAAFATLSKAPVPVHSRHPETPARGDEPHKPADSRAPVPAPPPTTTPTALPPLADAFAALLAAEHGEPLSSAGTSWPAATQAPPAIGDDLVETITERVLARISDRVVRETVAAIAERMIQEEIERIKSTIK